jgi:hypothetical protein
MPTPREMRSGAVARKTAVCDARPAKVTLPINTLGGASTFAEPAKVRPEPMVGRQGEGPVSRTVSFAINSRLGNIA